MPNPLLACGRRRAARIGAGLCAILFLAWSVPGHAAPKDDTPPLTIEFRPFWPMQRYIDDVFEIMARGQIQIGNWQDFPDESGQFDLLEYYDTARLYAGMGQPFRNFLSSLTRLNDGFRGQLATTRATIARVRKRPDSPEMREAVRAQLGALETLIRFPAATDNLVSTVANYRVRLERETRSQAAIAQLRRDQYDRREDFDLIMRRPRREADRRRFEREEEEQARQQIFIPGTNYPIDAGEKMRDWHPASPPRQLPPGSESFLPVVRDILPSPSVLINEEFYFWMLASSSGAALAAVPSFKACIEATKATEARLRADLREADANIGRYDQMSTSIDNAERHWNGLFSYATTCSDQRLWAPPPS
jgi:hypothetical protein